jgi:rhodanese-related sulfurtransferase
VARKLLKMGFKSVYVLKGGWGGWVGKGYPVEAK